jgi:hypothetical protein
MNNIEVNAVRFINTGIEMLLEHYGEDESAKRLVDPIMRSASELVNRRHPNDKMRFSTQLGLIPIEYDMETDTFHLAGDMRELPEGA